MENLRSLLLIKKIKDDCLELEYEPSDIETNPDSSRIIVDNGFIIRFKPLNDESFIFKAIEDSVSVKSYEVIEHNLAEALPDYIDLEPTAEEENIAIDIEKVKLFLIKLRLKLKLLKMLNQKMMQRKRLRYRKVLSKLIIFSQNARLKGKQNLISVNLNKLDELLDMVGEIVITEAMVTSSADLKGLELDSFHKSARQLRKTY